MYAKREEAGAAIMRRDNKHPIGWMALLLLAFIAGCCGTTSTGITPPTVATVTPVGSATTACTGTTVTVTFSEAMDPATINSTTFTMAGPGSATIAGQVTYDAASRTATLTPSSSLAISTLYTATLSTGVKDAYGNPLQALYQWTFTTSATRCHPVPVVISVTPPNAAAGVCPNTPITVTFSEPMQPGSVNAATFTVSPGVSGVLTHDSTDTIFTYTPSSSLSDGQTHTATITTGVEDTYGDTLAGNYVWTFAIAANGCNPPPVVNAVTPSVSATGVCPGKVVSATFSEAMSPSTINATTFTLTDANDTAVAGQVSYGASSDTAIFTPASTLALNATYTATITTGAMDLFGNSLASAYVWTFSTGNSSCLPPPPPVSVTPPNASVGVCSSAVITATFGQAMDPATLNATTFLLSGPGGAPIVGQITHDVTNKIYTLAPASTLALSTVYTVTITTEANDPQGNALASNFVWTFTTAATACTPGPLPTVIAVTPTAGSVGACQDAVATATFNKAMAPSSISTTTYTLAPGISGTVSLETTDKVATFTPAAPLALNTAYTALISTGATDSGGNALVGNFSWTFTTTSLACQPPVPLGSAAGFAVLAASSIANNGPSIISGGNAGVSPGSTVTGFPPGTILAPAVLDSSDVAAAQAESDLAFAYNYAAGLTGGGVLPAELSGLTLTPGLYTSPGPIALSTGQLILDGQGQANPVFIFQVGTSLSALAGTQVVMTNGTLAKNIFWQVGTTAELGASSVFEGTIMALQTIRLDASAALDGRALARGSTVTLSSNIVTAP